MARYNATAAENFYTAQVLWDESMADRSARALQDGASRIVILAGVGHVSGYRGIYQRLLRRRPNAKVLTIVPLTLDPDEDVADEVLEAISSGVGDILAVRLAREVLAL